MSEEPEQRERGQQQRPPKPDGRRLRGWSALPRRAMHRHALMFVWLGTLALMLAVIAFEAVQYLEGPQWRERVRRFAVEQLEQATGGRVELERVDWSLHRLEVGLGGLRIHGTEAAGEAPLLQLERVEVQLKWSELLAGRFELQRLMLLQPRVHVLVYPDGSTNLPKRKPKQGAGSAEDLLRLAVDQAELIDGTLDWNDEKIRLDGKATGVFVRLGYQPSDRHYEGKIRIKSVRLHTPERGSFTLAAASEFRLYSNRIEVSRLRVDEQHGWVELRGKVSGLASPVAQFTYRASCETDELARLLGDRRMHGGRLQASGRGSYHWKEGVYALTGKARASKASWEGESVRLEEVSGGMNFSLKPQSVKISNLFAVTLGGTLNGDLQWSTPPGKGKKQAGKIDLKVAGVALERILEAFSTEQLPLRRLPLSGTTDGNLSLRWQGELRNAQLEGYLRVSPVPRPGRLALAATVRAAVDFGQETVQISWLEAQTRATHLSGNGRLSSDSDFNLTLNASSLAELEPMVVAWRGSRAKDLPIDFSGRAVFRGTLRGRVRSPEVDGHLELHDFTTNVLVPSLPKPGGARSAESAGEKQAAAPRRLRTRWDLLQGEVHYSEAGESLRHGILRRGNTTIAVDATLGLAAGAYSRSRPFSARVELRKGTADEIQEVLGTHYPVKGKLSGVLEVSGEGGSLQGTGRVALKDGEAWQEPVRSASARIELTEKQVQLHDVLLTSDALRLTGDARMKLATREFAFHLRGSAVELEKIHALQARKFAVSGRASFEVAGEGTPEAPVVNGSLRLRELAIGKQKIGNMDVEAVTRGTELTLTARSQFANADLKVAGQVHLRGEMPMRLSADLHSAKLSALLADYLPVRLPAASELKLHAEISGDAKHPGNLAAEITVERITTSYGAILVANESPIRLKLENGVLHIVDLRLAGEKGDRFLQVRGTVPLRGEKEIHLRADGSLNLKLLQTLEPDLMVSGVATLHMRVAGTLKQPRVQGRLQVKDGTIAYIDFPNGLSDINGSLIFSEDRLQLQELTARTGGGLLHCSGFLSYVPSQGLGFNLTATGHEIRLRYPEGLSSSADANLMLSGTMKHALLSGDIVVTRLGVNQRFDFASYLAKSRRVAPAQTSESPLNNVRLDVHVTSTPELQVQTSLARLSGNLDLRIRGTVFRPVVLGRVNLLEGTLEFNGTKYRIERGDVTFTNPVRIEPTLDVELSARVRDYDLTLGFHGPLNKLTTTYRSDPPLSSSDIISLLALGRTAQEQANPAMVGTSQYQPSISESASMALLGQALNATVSSRVQKLFGVSRVKIDPNVGGAVNTSLARVTVEQQISNKLTLTYITNLNQSAQQIIQFEYNVNKGLTIVGVRDQNGVVSFDVVLRKRIK